MTKKQRQEIRENYKLWKPRTSPYDYYDWSRVFTPIENNVWGDIRYLGLPFYPQFPVDKYFIDFADPQKKIGIEVDGKEWHLDKAKDKERENELNKLGWQIIRIEGRQTFKEQKDFLSESDSLQMNSEEIKNTLEKNGYYNCSEGILTNLAKDYYGRS